VSRFNAPRVRFGRRAPAGGDDIPSPLVLRADAKRLAMLAEAGDVLGALPGPGESLHAVMTGRYDLMHLLAALAERLGRVDSMCVATLSYNGRNLAEMLRLLDAGAVGRLTLLCSAFFRDHNKELWEETQKEFRDRGQRAAAARSHCKVVTLALASGRRLSLEGSANLRTNSNREQFALTDSAPLHDWHSDWINELVAKHEGEAAEEGH
jgi:hypothetical protein